MTPAEAGHVLGDNWLFIMAISFFVWFVVSKVLETSKAAADLAGPLGRLAQKRKRKREERHREEVRGEAKRLLLDPDFQEAVEPPDYEELRAKIDRCSTELRDSRLERDALRSYVIEDEEWHFNDNLAAVREKRDPRSRLSWDEFYSKFRQGWRPDGQ